MNIDIKIGSLGSFSMELSEESAVKVFRSAVELAVKLSDEKKSDINSLPAEEKPTVSIAPSMEKSVAEKNIEYMSSLRDSTRKFYTEQNKGFNDKKFVVYYQCNCCKKISYALITDIEESKDIKCICGAHNTFNTDLVIDGGYTCNYCGIHKDFKVMKGTPLREIRCRGCSAPIDMKHNEKKDMFTNI